MVSLPMPRSSTALRIMPIIASCSIMPSAYSVRDVSPGLSRCDSRTWVRKCMRVELNQQKNGVFALACRCMKSMAAAELVVDRLHPLAVERAGVLDGLLADLAPARLFRRIVAVRRLAA